MTTSEASPVRHIGPRPIPAEGENGVFSESWFPICMSSEAVTGKILSRTFLDGRVIVLRGEDGVPHVMSAFCPHMGADLGVGTIEKGTLRCAFHRWGYDMSGACVDLPVGDPVPANAKLFHFPTVERFGLIWAFNGLEPWWSIPDLRIPDDQLSVRVRYDVPTFPVDPWVICSNTPDWQHFKVVHKLSFDAERIAKSVEWTEHSMEYDLHGNFPSGEAMEFRAGIFGTSLFRIHGTVNGEWSAALSPLGMPRPGVTQNYFVTIFEEDSKRSAEETELKHWMLAEFAKSFTNDDRPILNTARYRPGVLTKSDRMLSKYFDILRKYPRSHHSAEFIR